MMGTVGILLLIAIASVAAYLGFGARNRRERSRGRAPTPSVSSRGAPAPRAPAPPDATPGGADTGAFAGVEIHVSANACRPARALTGGIFLAAEAPALPLDGCTQARCRCSFQKLVDRRQESRRWSDEGLAATLYSAEERRDRDDRRGSGRSS